MIQFFQKLKAKKGFTLVELIVVIAIIGVLAAILIPTMLGYVTSSRVTSSDSTAATLRDTVNAYITARDTEGKSVKRVAGSDTNTIKITATKGKITCTTAAGILSSGATKAKDFDSKLAEKIKEDYDFTDAEALCFIDNGKCSYVLFFNGGTIPGSDVPKFNDFSKGSFAWDTKTAGITKAGEICGTSPKLQIS